MPKPTRRVIYRSVKARLARLALGVILAGATLWIVLPVLTAEHGPPAPVALVVGTNAVDMGPGTSVLEGIRPSALDLKVRAGGCVNPVTIEGTLWRSTATWVAEWHGRYAAPPTQAIITLAGARVRKFVVGVDSFSTEAPGGIQRTAGTARVTGLGYTVVVHNDVLPLIRVGDTTSAVLDAKQWGDAATPLGFLITADLIDPAGFDSCYLDLPELYPYAYSSEPQTNAFVRALNGLIDASARYLRPNRRPKLLGVAGTEQEELGTALVNASVHGRSVGGGSIGVGGTMTTGGVRYLCHSFARNSPSANALDPHISPEFDEAENPDCSGVPLFQAADVTSDTTRRLFAAGIIGALAATLIIEALFLGETESSDASEATAWRRRWRGAQKPD
jgi:hypothetical protein